MYNFEISFSATAYNCCFLNEKASVNFNSVFFCHILDEIFMPREIDSGCADQFEREIEEFKR